MTGNCLISLIIHILSDDCKIVNIHRIDPKFSENVNLRPKETEIYLKPKNMLPYLTNLINYSYWVSFFSFRSKRYLLKIWDGMV